MHLESIVLPALFAAAEHMTNVDPANKTLGTDFLLAWIVGCEVGPRVGLGLYGGQMLTSGWHSGAVFGPSASSAAVSKLLKLPANLIEDAMGIACTQACGLMSAQYESEVKRMQHGFAARNGLFAALLARRGYVGIKKVYEREYGGFLAMFGKGSGKTPPYLVDEVAKELGTKWQIESVRVKLYASMAGTHCTVDCLRAMREKQPEELKDLSSITSIKIELGEAAYHHGGWKAERPLTSTGAQMSNAYIAATYLVDSQVLPEQFRHDKLERDEVWTLVDKTTCMMHPDALTSASSRGKQTVTITFKDKPTLTQTLPWQRGIEPPLTNEEILEKWRMLAAEVIDKERITKIESLVLGLEECNDIALLGELMAGITKNPIA
jgi:aconitate decarboxylase